MLFFFLEKYQYLFIIGIFSKACHLEFIKAVSKLCFDSCVKYQIEKNIFLVMSSQWAKKCKQRLRILQELNFSAFLNILSSV